MFLGILLRDVSIWDGYSETVYVPSGESVVLMILPFSRLTADLEQLSQLGFLTFPCFSAIRYVLCSQTGHYFWLCVELLVRTISERKIDVFGTLKLTIFTTPQGLK